jgi:hypothetical protein
MVWIAGETVGAGGASSIAFSSIPSTFTHLELRCFLATNRATYGTDNAYLRVGNGSIDTGANYSSHELYGDGSSAVSGSSTSTSTAFTIKCGTSVISSFANNVMSILDYTNTNKYKTIRNIGGVDINGTIAGFGGVVALTSELWMNTAAITNISIGPQSGTLFTQNSRVDLYGITTSQVTGA